MLEVDLGAIVDNWRQLCRRVSPATCSAVVKADAYGLGAAEVSAALAGAGCSVFFVALPNEGAIVRQAVGPGPTIAILSGYFREAKAIYAGNALSPVLSTVEQLTDWQADGTAAGARPYLHVDSGMNRLGLAPTEWQELAAAPAALSLLNPAGIISHLACADEPDHPMNRTQLAQFRSALSRLPQPLPASLANSSGIFLGPDYHFAMARPGAALYGVNPTPGRRNPMRPVVRLRARVLQVRHIDRGEAVGYGASFIAPSDRKLATVAVGYADGLLRASSNRGRVSCKSYDAPIVGRVSMDMITIDITDAAQNAVQPGDAVDVIGPHRDVDAVAADAGTIGYEILTALGRRYQRRYVGSAAR